MSVTEAMEVLRSLPREHRQKAAHDLWVADDVTTEDPAAVEATWAKEISRRLQGIKDGTMVGLTDDEVMQRLGL